jgi:NitT/TauT family transport system substrate-binding protein
MKRLLLSACISLVVVSMGGSAFAAEPISSKAITIRLGYQPLTPTWGATVVTQEKLWKKYMPNVEVDRFDSMSGMPLVNNLVAGKVDIAYIGDMPAIVLASKSKMAATHMIAITDADHGGASVIYSKAGSSIKTVKDLDGKRISVPFGGYTHRFAEMLAEKEGIKYTFVGQSPEVGVTNLQTNKVDAYIPWPPYGPLAEHRGFGQKVVDGTKYEFRSVRVVVVRKEFADKHPDVVTGWLRAELDAHKIMRERPDYAAQLIERDWKRYDIPLEVVKKGFEYKVFPDDIAGEWRQVMVDGAAFLRKHDFISTDIDLDTFINDDFLKKAAAIPSQLDLSSFK